MLIVRSTCKRGKIIPLWGTESLLQVKEKRSSINKIKGGKENDKRRKKSNQKIRKSSKN
jgi:hypothetical protein